VWDILKPRFEAICPGQNIPKGQYESFYTGPLFWILMGFFALIGFVFFMQYRAASLPRKG
jgi:hypothetical protein